jgi:hypothetical protein
MRVRPAEIHRLGALTRIGSGPTVVARSPSPRRMSSLVDEKAPLLEAIDRAIPFLPPPASMRRSDRTCLTRAIGLVPSCAATIAAVPWVFERVVRAGPPQQAHLAYALVDLVTMVVCQDNSCPPATPRPPSGTSRRTSTRPSCPGATAGCSSSRASSRGPAPRLRTDSGLPAAEGRGRRPGRVARGVHGDRGRREHGLAHRVAHPHPWRRHPRQRRGARSTRPGLAVFEMPAAAVKGNAERVVTYAVEGLAADAGA